MAKEDDVEDTRHVPERPVVTTKERLLEAAEYLFGEHGYDATSMRDIAERAQSRVGLLTYHFATKESLYENLIERRAAEVGRRRLEMLARE